MRTFDDLFGDFRSLVARVRRDTSLAYKLVEYVERAPVNVLGQREGAKRRADLERYALDSLARVPAHVDSGASLADVLWWAFHVMSWLRSRNHYDGARMRRTTYALVWAVTVKPSMPPVASMRCPVAIAQQGKKGPNGSTVWWGVKLLNGRDWGFSYWHIRREDECELRLELH